MSGRNEQRKPGTARGSPRRSRTAKASRISRLAVKSRCAHEWDGWGRISDDGSGHYNPNPSEDPWGGGVISLHGGAQSSLWPDTVRDNRVDSEVHKGRMQTKRRTAHAGSRLKSSTITRLCGTSMRVPLRRNPYNPNPSEDPWGGGVISLHGGAQPRPRPDTVRDSPIITYSTPSVPLAGTPRFHREAAYTRCLRCAGAPRRPTSGSGLSLLIPS